MGIDLEAAFAYDAAIPAPQDAAIDFSPLKRFLRQRRRHAFYGLALVILIPVAYVALFIGVPAGNGKHQIIVELGRGRSLHSLAVKLEAKGIISSSRLFTLYARLSGSDSKVKAGYYQFDDGMRPDQILAKMVSGDIYQRIFALPEGYSTYQVAEILEKRGIFTREAFVEACRDRKLLADLGIHAQSAEGYLFPGSYNIVPGTSERALVKEMVRRQQELIRARFAPMLQHSRLSLRELLTLASMIEKEAMRNAEKPLIAAVFDNRLKRGMRLQSDPTALYGVRAFAGKVTKEDIRQQTPYNTYLIPGLPPGPIGNPGSNAMAAVLNHPHTPHLYFVAKGDGTHQFSATLAQHNQAVRRYLRSGGGALLGDNLSPSASKEP